MRIIITLLVVHVCSSFNVGPSAFESVRKENFTGACSRMIESSSIHRWIEWRSCHNGVTTHTSRPCYRISICIEIFSDVFLHRYVLMKRIITQFNRSWINAHIQWCQLLLNWVIIIFFIYPASAVLMYYAVLITGGTNRSLVAPLAQDRLLNKQHTDMHVLH